VGLTYRLEEKRIEVEIILYEPNRTLPVSPSSLNQDIQRALGSEK